MCTGQILYIPVIDVAKLVRRALKSAYPETLFRVRSSRYSGGASISVSWTDGPREPDEAEIVKNYAGGRFDGTIDMMHYANHWLRPDGSALLRHEKGSVGSGGESPEVDNRVLEHLMPEDAQPVHFGADFISVWRESSNPQPLTLLPPPCADDDGLPF